MRGKFITLEGVDGAGKSSVLEDILANYTDTNHDANIDTTSDTKIIYHKGFNKTSVIGKYINTHPSSILYYLDLAYKSQTYIRSKLKSGYIILQDRYVQSVDSFLPDANYIYNQKFRDLISRFFIKSDLYVYVTVSEEECIKRLKQVNINSLDLADIRYHETLMSDINRMRNRKKMYDNIYDRHEGYKIIIDTTGKSAKESAQILLNKLKVMNYVS